ncbi:uncharacterized protein LOC124945273 [Impatiens glandulifera]|uniref:uncharacterized protein LOC124945273 n=1 Tax=Impatiens glandulifera TaxID=253017 RepID=UPI001FB08D9A|nr:uncharacterized protein LOC124945273 [Impatiens glandulifera]
MWLTGGVGGGGGGGGARAIFVRYFCRKRAVDVKRISPKVPFQEAASIAESLYGIIKHNGPLTVSNTWNHAKEASIDGLNSKTHMKIMLKWMRGKNMLKLLCQHIGNNKKFMHTTLPEDPQSDHLKNSLDKEVPSEKKPSAKQQKKKSKK